MRVLLVALLVAAAAACDDRDPGGPAGDASTTGAAPATTGGPPTAAGRGRPQGFELAPARVTLADGTVCELCLWQAVTREQRRRGLQHVTELGPADGMVFVYTEPHTAAFWMRDTPMPLSIAWFDADGGFVSATEMEPCLEGPDRDCPRYAAGAPYTAAVELPAGRVSELGFGPGSVLELGAGDGCATVAGGSS